MSEQRQPTDRGPASPWQPTTLAPALTGQPASFWVAALASLGIIIGGVAPWATAFYSMSISGTSMHGWREVVIGVFGLVMLGLHLVTRARLPLIAAGAAGAFGAAGAIAALDKISSGGAVTVFGITYQYMNAAWGLYVVLAGTIVLLLSASVLTWRVSRPAR